MKTWVAELRVPSVLLSLTLIAGVLTGPAAASGSVPPDAPPSVNVTRTDQVLHVSWTADPAADSYHVTYSSDSGISWKLAAFEHTTNSIVITGVDNTVSYLVGVRAGNVHGYSKWVNSSLTGPYVPSTPTGLTVTRSSQTPKTGLSVTWGSVTEATGYELRYRPGSTVTWVAYTGSVGAGTLTVELAGLTAATVYETQVRAVDGSAVSGWSQTVSGATNRPPTVSVTAASVPRTSTAGTLVGEVPSVSDPDGDTLTFSLAGSSLFSIDSATGQVSVAPDTDLSSVADEHILVVTVDDGYGSTASASMTVTVTGPVSSETEPETAEAASSVDCSNSTAVGTNAPQTLVDDCELLLAAKTQLEGSGTALNWSLDLDMKDWHGIVNGELYTHPTLGRQLLQLSFNRHGLAGTLPASFANLSHATYLAMANNSLTGSIPTGWKDWTGLRTLQLFNNSLTGSIPVGLAKLPELRSLDLSGNNLSGSVPSDTTATLWPKITRLNLSDNSLSGSIPTDLGTASKLRNLNMAENSLSGSIPAEIGDLTELRILYLEDNSLSGSIPAEIGDLTKVEDVVMSGNSLSGSIPAEFGDLTEMYWLDLSENSLSGSIPTELTEATALEYLDLSGNSLSGSIPTDVDDLTNLGTFMIDDNQITGSIPTEVGDMSSLVYFWAHNNSLTGNIPTNLGDAPSLGTAAWAVVLKTNNLTGCIPDNLATYKTWIAAQKNGVTLPVVSELTVALSATKITSSSAVLSMSTCDDQWFYKQITPTQGTCSAAVLPSATVSLTDLSRATTYKYESYSDSGCSTKTATKTFTTEPEKPGKVPRPSAVRAPKPPQNAGMTGIKVDWEAPSDTGGATITGYHLLIETSYVGAVQACVSNPKTVNVSGLSKTVTGLKPTCLYFFRVRAVNSAGNGPWSYATKLHTNRPPVYQGSNSMSVLENSPAGTLVGDPADSTDPDGDTLVYSISGASEFVVDTATAQIAVSSSAALDYETTNSYTVTVTADDQHGYQVTETVTITILDDDETSPNIEFQEPITPTYNLGVDAPSVTRSTTDPMGSLDVDWTAPAVTSTGVLYNLSYKPSRVSGWVTYPETVVDVTETVLDGLEPNTRYEVRVQATYAGSVGGWSPPGAGFTNRPPVPQPAAFATEPALPAGTRIGDPLTATDPDKDQIMWGTETNTLFSINPETGQLVAKQPLEPDRVYTLVVTADDQHGYVIPVTVTVTPVSQYRFVWEPGQVVELMKQNFRHWNTYQMWVCSNPPLPGYLPGCSGWVPTDNFQTRVEDSCPTDPEWVSETVRNGRVHPPTPPTRGGCGKHNTYARDGGIWVFFSHVNKPDGPLQPSGQLRCELPDGSVQMEARSVEVTAPGGVSTVLSATDTKPGGQLDERNRCGTWVLVSDGADST